MNTEVFIRAVILFFHQLPSALLVTVTITLGATAIGITLGFFVALCHLTSSKVLSSAAKIFIMVVRAIPIPPFLYLVYFFSLIYIYPITPAVAGTIALGILNSPHIAELFRSGIQNVGRGRIEAGLALGMSSSLITRRIIIPIATRLMLPPIGQFIVGTLLNSAFVAILGAHDITGVSRQIISQLFSSELYILVALVYFVLAYPLSRFFSYSEKKARVQL